MALPIDNLIHDEITAKPGGQFDDGKDYGYSVVVPNPFCSFELRNGGIATPSGDLNVVLYEVDNSAVGIAAVAALLTEQQLRDNFDGVPA